MFFNQNPLLYPSAGTAGAERQFAPDRATDDLDDLDLGVAALEDDATGGVYGGGGSEEGVSVESWPNNFEEEEEEAFPS